MRDSARGSRITYARRSAAGQLPRKTLLMRTAHRTISLLIRFFENCHGGPPGALSRQFGHLERLPALYSFTRSL